MKWKKGEIEILKKYYKSEGMEVRNRLPLRTYRSVKAKALSMGLCETVRTRKRWKPEETTVLKKYYKQEGKEIMKRLPGFSWRQITKKANLLKLTNSREAYRIWNQKEEELLRENYGSGREKLMALLPGRDYNSIRKHASVMGLTPKSGIVWSELELQLAGLLFDAPEESILRFLPKRTPYAVLKKAYTLGFRLTDRKAFLSEEERGLVQRNVRYPLVPVILLPSVRSGIILQAITELLQSDDYILSKFETQLLETMGEEDLCIKVWRNQHSDQAIDYFRRKYFGFYWNEDDLIVIRKYYDSPEFLQVIYYDIPMQTLLHEVKRLE